MSHQRLPELLQMHVHVRDFQVFGFIVFDDLNIFLCLCDGTKFIYLFFLCVCVFSEHLSL